MPQPTPASPQEAARCTKTLRSVIGALDQGDYASASQNFDTKLRQQLTTDKLKSGWTGLTGKFGKRSGFGEPQSAKVQDVTVVVLPMTYSKGQLGAQGACNDKGNLVALQVGPMPGQAAATGKHSGA